MGTKCDPYCKALNINPKRGVFIYFGGVIMVVTLFRRLRTTIMRRRLKLLLKPTTKEFYVSHVAIGSLGREWPTQTD